MKHAPMAVKSTTTATTMPSNGVGSSEKNFQESMWFSRTDSSWLRRLTYIVAVIVVLALALGVGLGVGLRKKSPSKLSNGTGNATDPVPLLPDSYASLEVPPWRSNTLDYSLDLVSWDLDAPATTREHFFTIEERSLAPDGI